MEDSKPQVMSPRREGCMFEGKQSTKKERQNVKFESHLIERDISFDQTRLDHELYLTTGEPENSRLGKQS